MQYIQLIALTLVLAIGAQGGVIPVANHHLGIALVTGHLGVHDDWHGDHAGDWHDDHLGDWHGDVHGDWHGDVHGDWHDDHHGEWDYNHLGDWHDEGHDDWTGSHDDGHYEPHIHHGAVVLDSHLGLGHGLGIAHHEGQYVAKTRGALHKAPLAGHIASVAAINVAPAPGTH